MKKTPQQRAIDALEADGWAVDVVERVRTIRGRTWRNDLFGGFDLLAVDADGNIAAIQVTSRSNVSARVRKIAELPVVNRLRKAGWGLFVWGWGPTKTLGDWLKKDVS